MGQVHSGQVGRSGYAIGLAPGPTGAALPACHIFKATTFLLGAGAHPRGLHVSGKLPNGHFGAVDLQAAHFWQGHTLANLRMRAAQQQQQRHHG